VQLLPFDQISDEPDERSRDVTVTLTLRSPLPGQVGTVLDQLSALINQGMVSGEMHVPGYHQVFYGWESDEDDPPV
jgi:hypothetical protein